MECSRRKLACVGLILVQKQFWKRAIELWLWPHMVQSYTFTPFRFFLPFFLFKSCQVAGKILIDNFEQFPTEIMKFQCLPKANSFSRCCLTEAPSIYRTKIWTVVTIKL